MTVEQALEAPVVGRPLLAAVITAPAAAWLLTRVDEVDVRRAAGAQRSLGRPDIARAIELGYAQLREARRQWSDREGDERGGPIAAGGNAATAQAAIEPGSTKSVPSLPTRGVAAALGVTVRRARQLLEAGAIDGMKVGGHWFADPDSVRRCVGDRRLSA